MNRNTPAIGTVTVSLIVFLAASTLRAQPAASGKIRNASQDLIDLNIPFGGAATCMAADCHGAPARRPKGAHSFSNEYKLWSGKNDPHHNKTWADLTNKDGKAIAQALKIQNAAQSDRCLSCHALSVPEKPTNLRGEKYNLAEGVTCDACHGPSSKYLTPHQNFQAKWFDTTLAQLGNDGMKKKFGLYNTLDLRLRAERCTSCHLQIDADQVAAGHVQPGFELNWFSESYPDRHWEEVEKDFNRARIWLVGQQVELREALLQLAARATGGAAAQQLNDAYDQAMAHYAVFRHAFVGGALAGGPTALDAAIKPVQQAKGNAAALGGAAKNAAAAVNGMAKVVDAFKPQQATIVRTLQSLASDQALAGTYGPRGQEQQAYAIYALYGAYLGTTMPPNAADLKGAMADKLLPEKPLDAKGFVAALAQIKPQLPK